MRPELSRAPSCLSADPALPFQFFSGVARLRKKRSPKWRSQFSYAVHQEPCKKIGTVIASTEDAFDKRTYLAPNGYWHSYPADSTGDAVPWFTYPAIQFLKGVVQPSWRVLEYGCGYSTIFWNARCAITVSVEHDEYWFNHLKALHPDFDVQLVRKALTSLVVMRLT